MGKQCGVCGFVSDDDEGFAAHMRVVHGWTNEPRPMSAAARWRLIGCVGLFLVVGGPCGAFFLSYNGLPPFQISDASGQQFGLRRGVPGTVRYRTGWSVTVDPPRAQTLSDGLQVWLIPVTFENGDTSASSVGVASCELEVDGKYQSPFREPDQVRALGDDVIRKLEPGERWSARLAVRRPSGARSAELRCNRMAFVEATFDLSPYLSGP